MYSGDDQCLKTWDLRTGKEISSSKFPVTFLKVEDCFMGIK